MTDKHTYLPRLTKSDRVRSLIAPGTIEGINRILYCFGNELLMEISNRTMHCFWVLAVEPDDEGDNLFLALYIKRINWRTPI